MKVEEIRTDNTNTLKNALERITEFEKGNAELKEKFLTVKKDDVRKEKLNECKTFEEKVEYLRQVSNYALFNEDISVMFWCFYQRGEIDAEQIAKTKELIEKLLNAFASNDFFEEEELDAMAEAEQFLKEE